MKIERHKLQNKNKDKPTSAVRTVFFLPRKDAIFFEHNNYFVVRNKCFLKTFSTYINK